MSVSVQATHASGASAGSADDASNHPAPSADEPGELAQWFVDKVRPGRILSVGAGAWGLPSRPDLERVELDQLASTLAHASIFDHAWIEGRRANEADPIDPVDLLGRVHRALKPGGTLLMALPYGTSRVQQSRVYYLSSSRGLVEPFFDINEIAVVGSVITVAATRRSEITREVSIALSPDERAFHEHEQQLVHRIDDLARQLVQSGARYRGLLVRQQTVESELARTNRALAEAQRTLARIRPLVAFPLAVIRRIRRRRPHHPVAPPTSARVAPPAGKPEAETVTNPTATPVRVAAPKPDWRPAFRAGFEAWLQTARSAQGDEVVIMFSGTTFVQEQRGNRPIRLTNVYLDRQCPVFFNYYRWREDEPLPEHPADLLFQSPIDATPDLLDALVTADFGEKRKTFFASFPHELMVRYLTLAAQHGWVTIYDARDDWEEFAKIGMAKWYHPGYERYVAAHADIVTAVSRALARKMSALAGGRRTHVNPNGLDSRFPRPTAERHPGGQPVIGYFGHLTDKWFDWPLVIATAQRYPEYRFELAGHQAPKLDLPSNVELLGLLGHEEIAERSRTWSVAFIPFKNGPLADAVDPIKIYEYLHLGLPVLTTYFPQCRDYPGTVVTEGRDEFMDRLPGLTGTRPARAMVAEWLRHNTWECRVDAYRDLADELRRQGRTGVEALLGGAR
jgi:glycosyltransferase involved in cell wall biosynthesis